LSTIRHSVITAIARYREQPNPVAPAP
jgi:hypothetical protein